MDICVNGHTAIVYESNANAPIIGLKQINSFNIGIQGMIELIQANTDGHYFATKISLFNEHNMKEYFLYVIHENWIACEMYCERNTVISKNCQIIATPTWEGIKLYDISYTDPYYELRTVPLLWKKIDLPGEKISLDMDSGRILAISLHDHVEVWDIQHDKKILDIPVARGKVRLNNNGNVLGIYDPKRKTISIWAIPQGVQTGNIQCNVRDFQFNGDGDIILLHMADKIKTYPSRIPSININAREAMLINNGRYIVLNTTTGAVEIWDTITGERIAQAELNARHIAACEYGECIYVAKENQPQCEVEVWKLARGRIREKIEFSHTPDIKRKQKLYIISDGRKIAVIGKSGKLLSSGNAKITSDNIAIQTGEQWEIYDRKFQKIATLRDIRVSYNIISDGRRIVFRDRVVPLLGETMQIETGGKTIYMAGNSRVVY